MSHARGTEEGAPGAEGGGGVPAVTLTVPGAGGGVCARGQWPGPAPSAEPACKQPHFPLVPSRARGEVGGEGRGCLSHGELMFSGACLPARYANVTLPSVWVNSQENR